MNPNNRSTLECYKKAQEIIEDNIIDGKLDWLRVCNELYVLDNPVISEQELNSEECEVDYMQKSIENVAWTNSVYLVSWVLYNLKNKMENGHYWNISHRHDIKEPKCKKGSQYHNDLYTKVLKSFKDIIEDLEKNPPNAIV